MIKWFLYLTASSLRLGSACTCTASHLGQVSVGAVESAATRELEVPIHVTKGHATELCRGIDSDSFMIASVFVVAKVAHIIFGLRNRLNLRPETTQSHVNFNWSISAL